MMRTRLATILGLILICPLVSNAVPRKPTVILVDKKNNSLKVAEYADSSYRILKSYRATIGKVVGDKLEEGDLKTPEGIYTFKSLLRPPTIKPKFGALALYMNYPNPYDQLAGRTGYDIMLHATDEPERLKRDYDSEGCIVVKDHEIEEIKDFVRIPLTPIMVFDELTPEYLSPSGDPELSAFFNGWIRDWTGKNLDGYMDHYHSEFTSGKKNFSEWKVYKGILNRKYKKIDINPKRVQYFRHPKYSVIMFVQDYSSTLPNGRVAHRSVGTKTLYVAKEKGKRKIIAELFTNQMW